MYMRSLIVHQPTDYSGLSHMENEMRRRKYSKLRKHRAPKTKKKLEKLFLYFLRTDFPFIQTGLSTRVHIRY